MPSVRSLGLVVRVVDFSETSLVVTLFTRELGKVGAMAKGARRLKSPLQGGLDLLSVSDIVVLHKASDALDLVTEAVLVERFDSLRRDLAALYAGYYIAELLSELTDLHDPHPKLFDAATITLRHLGDPVLRSRRLLRFELACLRELGHMPRSMPVRTAVRRWWHGELGMRMRIPMRIRKRSLSAWRRAAYSAPTVVPVSRTWRPSRDGLSTRSACWRRRGVGGATSIPARGRWLRSGRPSGM